jgi:hypothetical protein
MYDAWGSTDKTVIRRDHLVDFVLNVKSILTKKKKHLREVGVEMESGLN